MPGRKMFPNSVVPLPSTPGLTSHGMIVSTAEPKHRAETMHLLFSRAPPADRQQELEERVANGEVIPIVSPGVLGRGTTLFGNIFRPGILRSP